MKCSVQKKDLLSLVLKTLNIVEKKATAPVLVNALLEISQDGVLKIFATDLEVSLTDSVPVKSSYPGKLAVPAKSFFEIIKELDDGMAIELNKTPQNWLEIQQGRYLSHIVGVAPDEYPVFPTYTSREFVSIESQLFQSMIDKTIYAVSTDETRLFMNGIYVEKIDDKLRMVSTDGHRLALIDRDQQQYPQNFLNTGIIVPRKGLVEIRKLIETSEGPVDIAVEESQLIVKQGYTLLMIRLIEGNYPKYQQFIPQRIEIEISIDKDLFLSALRRVSLLSHMKSKGVVLKLKPNALEISSSNPDLGDALDEVPIEYKGEPMKLGFNSRFILEALNTFPPGPIEMSLQGQMAPALFKSTADPMCLSVIMPMKI